MTTSTATRHDRTPLPVRRYTAPEQTSASQRHWFRGEPAATHLLNAYTLLVPDNEGFYIRTLNEALPRIGDPSLRESVREFSRQEGQHGVAHRNAWTTIEKQGYRVRGFVRFADVAAFSLVERFAPLRLKVAIVACVEHLNAAIGYEYLARGLLDGVDDATRSMFEWHFAEEIEHKHVSFDVMQHLGCGYGTRLASTAVVVPLFYALLGIGTTLLMWQDRSIFRASSWSGWFSHAFGRRGTGWRMAAHVLDYLRPGFRPSQRQDADLAEAALARWPNVAPRDAAPETREHPLPLAA